MHMYIMVCVYVIIIIYCIGIGVDTSDPAVMALQLCYSDIKKALDSHITAVVSLSFSQCLLPSDIHSTIISSLSMPSGDKLLRDKYLQIVINFSQGVCKSTERPRLISQCHWR